MFSPYFILLKCEIYMINHKIIFLCSNHSQIKLNNSFFKIKFENVDYFCSYIFFNIWIYYFTIYYLKLWQALGLILQYNLHIILSNKMYKYTNSNSNLNNVMKICNNIKHYKWKLFYSTYSNILHIILLSYLFVPILYI